MILNGVEPKKESGIVPLSLEENGISIKAVRSISGIDRRPDAMSATFFVNSVVVSCITICAVLGILPYPLIALSILFFLFSSIGVGCHLESRDIENTKPRPLLWFKVKFSPKFKNYRALYKKAAKLNQTIVWYSRVDNFSDQDAFISKGEDKKLKETLGKLRRSILKGLKMDYIKRGGNFITGVFDEVESDEDEEMKRIIRELDEELGVTK